MNTLIIIGIILIVSFCLFVIFVLWCVLRLGDDDSE